MPLDSWVVAVGWAPHVAEPRRIFFLCNKAAALPRTNLVNEPKAVLVVWDVCARDEEL